MVKVTLSVANKTTRMFTCKKVAHISQFHLQIHTEGLFTLTYTIKDKDIYILTILFSLVQKNILIPFGFMTIRIFVNIMLLVPHMSVKNIKT